MKCTKMRKIHIRYILLLFSLILVFLSTEAFAQEKKEVVRVIVNQTYEKADKVTLGTS